MYDLEQTKNLFDTLVSYPLTWQLIVQIAALEAKHLDNKKNTITIEQALVNISGEGLKLEKTKNNNIRKVAIPKELMKALSKLKLMKQTQLMEVQNLREWPDNTFYIF